MIEEGDPFGLKQIAQTIALAGFGRLAEAEEQSADTLLQSGRLAG